jgi:hypothetical protein
MPNVLGQVHRRHAALADQALDGIAPFERGRSWSSGSVT